MDAAVSVHVAQVALVARQLLDVIARGFGAEATVLAHAVLHVDLLGLVAGESGVDPVQVAAAVSSFEFVAVIEVRGCALPAEEVEVAGPDHWYVGPGCELAHAGVGVAALRQASQRWAPALEVAARALWHGWLDQALNEP
ncbi:hypothetical protein [Azohydromonas australica]|uniref:hypothetical protein n=1 Tax=Azohydromonas australica TaxID=364039 RepID=UPI000411C3EF